MPLKIEEKIRPTDKRLITQKGHIGGKFNQHLQHKIKSIENRVLQTQKHPERGLIMLFFFFEREMQ